MEGVQSHPVQEPESSVLLHCASPMRAEIVGPLQVTKRNPGLLPFQAAVFGSRDAVRLVNAGESQEEKWPIKLPVEPHTARSY